MRKPYEPIVFTGENGEVTIVKPSLLTKSHNHKHYGVVDGTFYEVYSTIRGLRHRYLAEVNFPDTEILSEEQLKEITKQLENGK